MTKKEKKKKKKVKKTGLSFADDDPSEETENFKLKKSSRYALHFINVTEILAFV